jgi:hypothetical protein
MKPRSPTVPASSGSAAADRLGAEEQHRALVRAADLAGSARSVRDTRPWCLDLRSDRLLLLADRSRQLTATDPTGRGLVQSVGAALFNARAALAVAGWGAHVARLPDPRDADLLAVVRPLESAPDPTIAALGAAAPRSRAHRRGATAETVPEDLLRVFGAAAATEGAVLAPVVTEEHRRLVARLIRHAADRLHDTAAAAPDRDGGVEWAAVLLATPTDDPQAWLRCGEAMQRVLLEATRAGWDATLVTAPVEVPLTRTQLRSALTWDAHPQVLLRFRRPPAAPRTT